jgi:hypothetical protein
MHTHWHDALITLQPGEMLWVCDGLGSAVVVFRGQLWLTQDDDLRDIFIGTGESFTLDAAAPALLQATETTQLTLVATPRPAPADAGHLARVATGLRHWLAATRGGALRPMSVWTAPGRCAC